MWPSRAFCHGKKSCFLFPLLSLSNNQSLNNFKDLFGYHLLLKHCSKINFECVNSVMKPSFEAVFVEKSTCGSREQCTGSTKNADKMGFCPFWAN